jgi:hypothetical protein
MVSLKHMDDTQGEKWWKLPSRRCNTAGSSHARLWIDQHSETTNFGFKRIDFLLYEEAVYVNEPGQNKGDVQSIMEYYIVIRYYDLMMC